MNGEPAKRPVRRRWYQFSLRTLIVAMVLMSALLGLFAARLQRARRQAAAVAVIRRCGGDVAYDFALKRDSDESWIAIEGATSLVPKPLVSWLGEDFFHRVLVINLPHNPSQTHSDLCAAAQAASQLPDVEELLFVAHGDTPIGSPELKCIASCTRLTRLHFWGEGISDEGLPWLQRLTRLNELCLASSRITDQGLLAIEELQPLKSLDLNYTQISDRGLSHLTNLENLEELYLEQTPITGKDTRWPPALKKLFLSESHISDEGLKSLSCCRFLERLDIDGTAISDEGLRTLGKIKSLRRLSLSRINLSSEGVQHLKELPCLECLDLSGTFVDGECDWPAGLQRVDLYDSCLTDKGLLQLARCPKLRSASFSNSLTTADGRKAFAKARPDVR